MMRTGGDLIGRDKARVIFTGLFFGFVVLSMMHAVVERRERHTGVLTKEVGIPAREWDTNVIIYEYWVNIFVWKSSSWVLRVDTQLPSGVDAEVYKLIDADVQHRLAVLGLQEASFSSILLMAVFGVQYIVPLFVSFVIMRLLVLRHRREALANVCENCGYSLMGLESVICPECGCGFIRRDRAGDEPGGLGC